MNAPANCEPATNWEEIYTRLLAYTRSLAKGKAWFRGGKTTSFLMGKEAEDYTLAAIGKYLEEPDKFDPSKGELLDYLKYNLVRSLVANDLRKQENKLTDDVFAVRSGDDEEDNSSPYLDRVLPHIEALFADNMDYEAVKSYIEAEIKDDGDVENIFLGKYSYGMKPREIMKEFGMEAKAYNNGMRRLTTVLDRAALHFNKTKQTV